MIENIVNQPHRMSWQRFHKLPQMKSERNPVMILFSLFDHQPIKVFQVSVFDLHKVARREIFRCRGLFNGHHKLVNFKCRQPIGTFTARHDGIIKGIALQVLNMILIVQTKDKAIISPRLEKNIITDETNLSQILAENLFDFLGDSLNIAMMESSIDLNTYPLVRHKPTTI
jgi:hypothetical protein